MEKPNEIDIELMKIKNAPIPPPESPSTFEISGDAWMEMTGINLLLENMPDGYIP